MEVIDVSWVPLARYVSDSLVEVAERPSDRRKTSLQSSLNC